MAKDLQKQEVAGTNVPESLENLTVKQRKFAELYAVNGNASKSAILAGYQTAGNGHDIGYALVNNVRVIPAIEYYRELFADSTAYTPEKIVKEWAELASVDVSEFVTDDWDIKPKDQLTAAQRQALVGLEIVEKKDGRTVKFKFAKVEAKKELGKLLGMYQESSNGSTGLDITINLGNQVNVSVSGDESLTETEIGHLTIKTSAQGGGD